MSLVRHKAESSVEVTVLKFWGVLEFLEIRKCFFIALYPWHGGIIQMAYDKFPDFFFVWALLLIIYTWNSSPLRSNLLRMQCTSCTVPTTSWKPHRSPLVGASQSLQLSHNDSLWAKGITIYHREQGLDYREGDELASCPSWSNSLWQGWNFGLQKHSKTDGWKAIWSIPYGSLEFFQV